MQLVVFTPEMTDFVVRNYRDMDVREMANELGVSYGTLRSRLPAIAESHGFKLRKRGSALLFDYTDEQWANQLERYNKGVTLARLAKQSNTNASTSGYTKALRRYANRVNAFMRSESPAAYLLKARNAAIVEMVIDRKMTYGSVAYELRHAGVTRSTVAGVIMRHRDRKGYY